MADPEWAPNVRKPLQMKSLVEVAHAPNHEDDKLRIREILTIMQAEIAKIEKSLPSR